MHGRTDLELDWPTPESYVRAFEGRIPLNIAVQAPHLPIRVGVMGWEARVATDAEIAAMAAAVDAWMQAGAVGFNTGLDYQPTIHSAFASSWRWHGSRPRTAGSTRHTAGTSPSAGRDSSARRVQVGREAGLPAHVSHERVDDEMAALLDGAMADVTTDSHLYEAGSTHLVYYLPAEDQVGGPAAVLERLESAAYRTALVPRLEAQLEEAPAAVNAWFSATRSGRHIGRSVADIAAERGTTAAETVVDLLREELPDALMVYPWGPHGSRIPTDRRAHPSPSGGDRQLRRHLPRRRPHPRGYGTFPRAIRVGVRELRP